MNPLDLLWLFFILSSLQPMVQQKVLAMQRAAAMRTLEKRNSSRVITLIHRREGFAILGIPFGGFIDIDDSEAVIRAIEMTSDRMPIDLVLHTPGGLVLAAEQIASALAAHPAPVTVYVPHYAMSGGTLIALAAERIVMSPSAVLGPVDPQLGDMPAASILAAVERKDVNELDDKTLILADVGRKAQRQVRDFVARLLRRHLPDDRAEELAVMLSEGRWTHDYPIEVDEARKMGLPVSDDLPDEVRQLMRLYPQPRGRRPSVEYIATPYEAPTRPNQPRKSITRRSSEA
jgi:ClpP class serine protease